MNIMNTRPRPSHHHDHIISTGITPTTMIITSIAIPSAYQLCHQSHNQHNKHTSNGTRSSYDQHIISMTTFTVPSAPAPYNHPNCR